MASILYSMVLPFQTGSLSTDLLALLACSIAHFPPLVFGPPSTYLPILFVSVFFTSIRNLISFTGRPGLNDIAGFTTSPATAKAAINRNKNFFIFSLLSKRHLLLSQGL